MEVHPDEVAEVEELSQYAFVEGVVEYLKDVYDVEFNVPLDIEAKFGTYWNE